MIKNTRESQCNCICHNEGTSVMHCMPCCDWTYVHFRDKDGKVIQERVDRMLDMKRIDGEPDEAKQGQ